MSSKKKTKTLNSRSKNDIVKEGEHEKVMKGFIDLEETSLAKDEMTISGDNIMSAVPKKTQTVHDETLKDKKIKDPKSNIL